MQAELRRTQQRIGVGTHREERDVAQIKQPRVTDHDVQPQRQHDVEQSKIGDAHPAVAEQRIGDKRKHQQRDDQYGEQQLGFGIEFHARSATLSPSKPDGLNTSTAINTKNANTS